MSWSFAPAAAGGEYMQVLPGLAECFEMDSLGMRTADSVDYGVLIDGELHHELDDGVTGAAGPFAARPGSPENDEARFGRASLSA